MKPACMVRDSRAEGSRLMEVALAMTAFASGEIERSLIHRRKKIGEFFGDLS